MDDAAAEAPGPAEPRNTLSLTTILTVISFMSVFTIAYCDMRRQQQVSDQRDAESVSRCAAVGAKLHKELFLTARCASPDGTLRLVPGSF